jgi:hypothetical protein
MPESLAPLSLLCGETRTPAHFRDEPTEGDRAGVRELTAATGFFSDEEVAVAVELVEARPAQGLASGYRFFFAERGTTWRATSATAPSRSPGRASTSTGSPSGPPCNGRVWAAG